MSGVAEVNPKYLAEAASHTVPVGYKQTEVGVIPEDWEVMRLGHLAKFFKGSGLPKSELSESGKIKCIHYGQLFTTYGPKIDRVISRTKNVGIVTSQENDVLMPTSDVTPNGLATASCITETGVTLGGDILIIRSDKQKLNGVFFSYLVNVLRDQVMQLVTGSTVYHLYGSDMAKFEFAFPSKEEQIAIANALSDVDALISELEKLIAKKQAIKTATMQQLLTGRTRLPQFALRDDGTPKSTKPSELGEIPEDWEVHSLGDLCNYQNGKAQEQYFNSNGGYKVVSIGNYSESGRYIDTGSYIDEKFKNEVGRFVLSRGDLAMILNDKTAIGTIIGRVLLIEADETYVMNQRTMRLAPKGSVKSKYLHFLLNSDSVHKRIVGMAKPGTQIYVNTDDVLGFNLLISNSQEEQTAIATILSDMDAEIQALEQRLGKTRQIKQGMMQELLTGKTRLPIT